MKLSECASEMYDVDILEPGCECDGCGKALYTMSERVFWEICFDRDVFFYCDECEERRKNGFFDKDGEDIRQRLKSAGYVGDPWKIDDEAVEQCLKILERRK